MGIAAYRGSTGFISAEKLIFLFPSAIVVYLVLPPLILLLVSSFKSTVDQLPTEPGPWTLFNYIQVFSKTETYFLFQTSLLYAMCSVLGAIIIASLIVWLIERTDLPVKNLIFTLLLTPIAIPGFVKAIGWAFLASPRVGVLNVALRNLFAIDGDWGPLNIYSLPGIIFVGTLSMVPSIILLIAGPFRSFDPSFEEASQASGASGSQTQRFITLPLLRPALLAAFIFFFTSALDDFQIPAILGLNAGIQVFSTKIYLATHPSSGIPNFGLASAYSILLFIVAIALILLYQKMMRMGERFAVVTGKGFRPRRVVLGKWKYAALVGVTLYLLLAAILPLIVLIWMSLQPYFSLPSARALARLTSSNYYALWELGQFRQAVLNTIVISLLVATGTVLLSGLVAWIGVRGQFRGKSVPGFLTFINMAVPSVVLGLAIMFVYLSFPVLPIYGTIWILVIAYVTKYLAYATRLMGAAVIQIHQELEEASLTSGGSRWDTLYRITLPLLFPSFLNGWLWVAIHALREATLAVMLVTPANVVLSSLIWERWRAGADYGSVAAMSVLVVGASFLLTLIGRQSLQRGQLWA